MAASQATLELRNNTDANFRLWGKFISDGLAAGGWTKMDTDITWASVTAPAQNTYAGYEVWQSPAETGLTQFYLKLRYGSHNNATIGPGIAYQLSWGYPGSGSSLSGVASTELASITGSASAASATARLCTIAVGDGYVVINLGNGSGVECQHIIALCRTRNANLDKQDQILHYMGSSLAGNTGYRSRVLDTQYEYPLDNLNQAVTPSQQNTYISTQASNQAVQSGRVGTSYLTGFRGERTSPMEVFLGVQANALGVAGQTVQIPIYGVTRTFMIGAAGAAGNPGNWGITVGASFNPLYLYE